MFGLQLVGLALGQIQRLQFPDLIAQQFEPGVAFAARLLQLPHVAPERLPLVEGAGHRFEQRRVIGVVVQQLLLHLAPQQAVVFVLAMQIHQHLAQFAQQAGGRGLTVDKGAGRAIGADDAADDAFLGAVQFVFPQPALGLAGLAGVESHADFRLLRTVADHAAVGPVPQRQPQGIEQDRLARPGFPGEHRHARLKLEIELLDDGEVPDVDVGQHGMKDTRYKMQEKRDKIPVFPILYLVPFPLYLKL